MPELEGPYEIYEWEDGKTETWTILDFEEGQLEITPRDGRPPKEIDVLRIHLSAEEKPDYPQYWDLTSKRLVAQLKGILGARGLGPIQVTITAIGRAPRTHFSVSKVPVKPG